LLFARDLKMTIKASFFNAAISDSLIRVITSCFTISASFGVIGI
jgi:hypothetical protein